MNNHLLAKLTEHTKKTDIYDVGNPGPGFGQAQKCVGVRSQTYPMAMHK
jgi:hypothetical protein